MHSSSPKTGIALSFVCLAILGIMPVIANSRPAGSSALGFAFFLSLWQLIFSLPLFLHELFSGKKGIFRGFFRRKDLMRVIIVNFATGMMFGLATWCYILAMERAGVISASIAIQAYPLFALVMEILLLQRWKTVLEIVFTLILVVALYYLGTGGTWRLQGISIWFVAALAVPFLWSIAHVLIRQELMHTPITPSQVTFFRVALSTLFLGGIFLMEDPSELGSLFHPEILWPAMVMGLFYYTELLLWFHAMKHIDVSLASAITTPWPAVTMVLAAIFLNERINFYQVVTFFVVGGSVYILLLLDARKNSQ
ncbi:MAG: DMT family transporter [Desulfobacterales bacterium]|nr:DMT family transporter [Desulfobacterales bacterium]